MDNEEELLDRLYRIEGTIDDFHKCLKDVDDELIRMVINNLERRQMEILHKLWRLKGSADELL